MKKYIVSFLLFCLFTVIPQVAFAADTTPPTIENITVTTQTVEQGEVALIEVTTNDESAISRVAFSMQSSDGTQFVHSNQFKLKEGTTNVYIAISNTIYTPGTFEIYNILVLDANNNVKQLQLNELRTYKLPKIQVVEPTQKTYTQLAKFDSVKRDKVFTITFYKLVDESSVNERTIYAKDANGARVLTQLKITHKNNQSIVTVTPISHYRINETYNLYIEGIVLRTGTKINVDYVVPFNVKP